MSMNESTATRWIPTIVVLVLCVIILLAVIIIYCVSKAKRVKLDFFAEYHKHRFSPKNYCTPGGSGFLSPSVTIETQLSVCALDDDKPYSNIVPSHVLYGDARYSRADLHCPVSSQPHQPNTAASRGSMYDKALAPSSNSLTCQQEILLAPTMLADDDDSLLSPLFLADISSSSDYYSSLSLPVESGDSKTGAMVSGKRPRILMYGTGDHIEDSGMSYYVEIQKASNQDSKRDSSVSPQINTQNITHFPSHKPKTGMRRMVQKCKRAGASIVHGVTGQKSSESASYNDCKVEDNLVREPAVSSRCLRRPINSFRSSKSAGNKSAQNALNTFKHIVPNFAKRRQGSIEESDIVSSCVSAHDKEPPVITCQSSVGCSNQEKVLNKFKNLSKLVSAPKGKKKCPHSCTKEDLLSDTGEDLTTPIASDVTYVNEAFEKTAKDNVTMRKLSLRKIKVPNLLKRLSKTS